MRTNSEVILFILLFQSSAVLQVAAQAPSDGGLPHWITADPFSGSEDDPLGASEENLQEIVSLM